jgi:hypothetical protein
MWASALIMLWMARDRFRLLAGAVRGRDVVEAGLSMRFVAILGITSFLALWILMSASGIPVIIALMWIVMYFLYHVTTARAQAQYVDHPGSLYAVDWRILWPTGVALGYWPETFPSNQTWLLTRAITFGQSSWVPRCGGWFGITGVAPLYKVAREFNVDLKQMLIAMIGVAVLGTPLVYITGYYFCVHGGGFLNTRLYNWVAGSIETQGVMRATLTPGATFSMEIGWTIIGVILGFAFYAIKAFLPWIPIDPYWMSIMLINVEWYWLMALASLITRIVVIRVVGPETYARYVVPVSIGALVGYGAVYTLSTLANFGLVCLPKFLSLYTP